MNTRVLAAKTLAPVFAGTASLSRDFDKNIEKLAPQEKPFFQELCYGCLRQFHHLDCIAKELIEKPLRNKDQDIYAIILMGLYQLKFMRVPDHAAISESVEATKKLKKNWASKLVNGILRNYQRQTEALDEKLKNNPVYTYSHPGWLIGKIKKAWPQNWEAILAANNTRPPITIRVNVRKTDIAAYKDLLEQNNIAYKPTALSTQGLQLLNSATVTELPGYKEGLFSVQDEGAQLAAELLNIKPNTRVLDCCCAPGGKSGHLIESKALNELVCVELEEQRMQRVHENLDRLGHTTYSKTTLIVDDACNIESWWDGIPFDGILLDAPCSASGVIRRHPDIKLLRRPDDLVKLAQLQANMLQAVWQTLAPGGVLVYVTCSVLPEENEKVVQAFIKHQADARHDPISELLAKTTVGRQLFPQEEGHDGFYYARLIKIE